MKTKRILSIVLCLVLMVCTAGCGDKKESDVPQPDMAMETVTQNSLENYVTFEFQLPEGWASAPHEYANLGAIAYLESSLTDDDIGADELYPYKLDIGNYYSSYYSSGETIPKEIKQMYSDLLSGKPETYQAFINQPPPSLDIGDGKSFLGFLNALTSSAVGSSQPSDGTDYITDFQYKLYHGKSGKIAEVQYRYKINDQEFHTIECYLEKMPYMVSGTFDDSLEISSGDLALWVADSLKVDEHFSLKNGKIEKKD